MSKRSRIRPRMQQHERPSHQPESNEGQPNPAICVWCANQQKEACLAQCQAEGRYRYLEPATLAHWELPPELPPFRVLMALPAIERLALVYLAAVYERREAERQG